jgi:hypothetical protein
MIQIDNTLISLELLEEQFVCDLNACKGACCVEGDSGAPLEDQELGILKQEWEHISPFLREEGRNSILEQGVYVNDEEGDWVTPLRDGKECAYTVFDNNGQAACGIERAWKAGATTFRKPISCHLYPVRIKRYPAFDAVNYERWYICNAACKLGSALKVPVYVFLKEALIRKYGPAWYEVLEEANLELRSHGQIGGMSK